jgi:hypothetical protein
MEFYECPNADAANLDTRITYAEKLHRQKFPQLEHLRTILICALDRDPSVNFERFLKYPTEGDLDSDQTLRLIPKPQRETHAKKARPTNSRAQQSLSCQRRPC